MCTKQLKEAAIQLANSKELNENQTDIWSNSNLSLEQKQALASTYDIKRVTLQQNEKPEPFWG